MLWLFVLLALVGGAAVWQLLGAAVFWTQLRESLQLLLQILPIIVFAMLLAGYFQVLVPRERMRRQLGEQSGLRGLLIATGAGAITPGGPFAAFPLVLALYQAGAGFGTCVAYVTSWSVLGLTRVLVFEVPLLGREFVMIRLLVSLPLPLLAGYIARHLAGEGGR